MLGSDNQQVNTEPISAYDLRILDAHYGYMGMEFMASNVYQQFFVFPIKVTQLTSSKHLRKQSRFLQID